MDNGILQNALLYSPLVTIYIFFVQLVCISIFDYRGGGGGIHVNLAPKWLLTIEHI